MPVAVHSMLAMFEDKFYFFFTVYLALSLFVSCVGGSYFHIIKQNAREINKMFQTVRVAKI